MLNDVQQGMKKYFSHVYPLIFYRSVEKAKTNSELFDILQEIPKQYPIIWNEELRRWVHTKELLQNESIGKKK